MDEKKPGNRPRTGNSTSFKKGQSGNPSGRPKQTPEEKDTLRAIRELAPEAVNVLRGILRSKKTSAAVRLKAAEAVLNRTYGKAETPVKLDVETGEEASARRFMESLTDAELAEYEKLCQKLNDREAKQGDM